MSDTSKKMVVGSMAAAGVVAVAALLDLALGVPFARHVVMDVMFLIGAGIVMYMGYEAYQEMR